MRVPLVVGSNGPADDVAGGREAIRLQQRQRLGERVHVAIIEGQHHLFAVGPVAQMAQPFAHRHTPQPEPAQGPQLPLELRLSDVQQLERLPAGPGPTLW